MSGLELKVDVFDLPADRPPGGHSRQLSAAGIVHDLGNLIQVASSALNHLARDPSVSAAPELGPVIAGAKTALERAGGLVRQTIGAAGGICSDIQQANVSDCLLEIETLIRSAWDASIRLEVRVEPDMPLIRCDRIGLQNAVLNLLFNARDAMPDGGLISVGAALASERTTTGQVDILVEDNGIGMTEETMARAFDPFFTTKGKGLGGVGLPMVKRFAEESGGGVAVQSTLGAGTTVTLRLPAVRSATNSQLNIP
ncbi:MULTISPECIES: ATP-binding protein [unclassified Mesorhizobium]|uniref:sensor histidine kinase n=1 Tax=unclassified Mesorhizobium TaxID=325217 RepID=UPI000BAF664F|nr:MULTISPECIES: ATP-binding protein [unclassified Mesorhizobium]PBB27426.1 ATP-binding protein [Mesorhizobium sp. WSM4304]PBB77028.1 ATP-binding protein [Mesorhizobium sp. WSM4308]